MTLIVLLEQLVYVSKISGKIVLIVLSIFFVLTTISILAFLNFFSSSSGSNIKPVTAGTVMLDTVGDAAVFVENFRKCSDPGVTVSLDSMNCSRESLESIAKAGDVELALSLLEDVVKVDPAYVAACHGWSHSIGLAAAASPAYPTIDSLFDISWPNCTYGFYHGVQSFYLESMDSLDNASSFYDLVCTPSDSFPFKEQFSSECGHLVGHFIADLSVNDPYTGFDSCLSLGDIRDSACIDGLLKRFAEFIDLENGGSDVFVDQNFDISSFDSLSFFNGSAPEVLSTIKEFCDELPRGPETTCAKRTPAVAFRLLERDFKDSSLEDKWRIVHDFCSSFSSNLQGQCFEGIGVMALNMSGWDPDVLIEACTYNSDFSSLGAASCVKAVALAFGYNNPSSSADEAFCKFVPSPLLEPCREGFAAGV